MQWLPIQFIIKVHIRHSIVIKEYLQYLIIAKVKGSFYSLLEKYKKPAKIHPAPTTFVNLLIHQCHEGNCYCQNCLVSTLVWSTFSMSSWVSLTLAVFWRMAKNWKKWNLGKLFTSMFFFNFFSNGALLECTNDGFNHLLKTKKILNFYMCCLNHNAV